MKFAGILDPCPFAIFRISAGCLVCRQFLKVCSSVSSARVASLGVEASLLQDL